METQDFNIYDSKYMLNNVLYLIDLFATVRGDNASFSELADYISRAEQPLKRVYIGFPEKREDIYEAITSMVGRKRILIQERDEKHAERILQQLDGFCDMVSEIFHKPSKPILKGYTLKQQILICDYTGVLEALNRLDISDKKRCLILSALLGKDEDNIRKALADYTPIEKGEGTKTRKNLEKVKEFFQSIKIDLLINKVNGDIAKIKKG